MWKYFEFLIQVLHVASALAYVVFRPICDSPYGAPDNLYILTMAWSSVESMCMIVLGARMHHAQFFVHVIFLMTIVVADRQVACWVWLGFHWMPVAT